MLTTRWRPMLMHAERRRLLECPSLHRVVAAGRRSGKTEDAKRIIIAGDKHHCGVLTPPRVPNPRFGIFGPTREQLKRNWWDDIKAMVPPWAVVDRPREDDLSIQLVTGAKLYLIGLDRPQRAEGDPFDGVILDETQEIKEEAWTSSLYPTTTNRGRPPGWSLRIGRPKGQNHFYNWFQDARDEEPSAAFTWFSSLILPPEMIQDAKDRMDSRSFRQEYEAEFLTQTGLVYDRWDEAIHVRDVSYEPDLPLLVLLDFNVKPGSAVIAQEQHITDRAGGQVQTTCIIDEVHIADESRTERVCREIAAKFPNHPGSVEVYGDPAGHQRRTSASATDWIIAKDELSKSFRDVTICVGRRAPGVLDSVNATNSRLQSASGIVRLAVAPRCKETIRDFGGVVWDERKADREIDKRDLRRTHWSDAVRYYVAERFPIDRESSVY